MRARLSAISNFTTSQLLRSLQTWTKYTSEIIVDGQVLTVTSVYFLSNDTTSVLTSPNPSDTIPVLTSPSPSDTTLVLASGSPNQTSNYETNTNDKVILFSAIGSAGGLSLFICVCCIIISVCIFKKFKSKRSYLLKKRFVVHTILNNDVITIYIGYM